MGARRLAFLLSILILVAVHVEGQVFCDDRNGNTLAETINATNFPQSAAFYESFTGRVAMGHQRAAIMQHCNSSTASTDNCALYPAIPGPFSLGYCIGSANPDSMCWPRLSPCWLGRPDSMGAGNEGGFSSFPGLTSLANDVWNMTLTTSGTREAINYDTVYGDSTTALMSRLTTVGGFVQWDFTFFTEFTIAEPTIIYDKQNTFTAGAFNYTIICTDKNGVSKMSVTNGEGPRGSLGTSAWASYIPTLPTTGAARWRMVRGAQILDGCKQFSFRMQVISTISQLDIKRLDIFGVRGTLATNPPSATPTTTTPSAFPTTSTPSRVPVTSSPTASPTPPSATPTLAPSHVPSVGPSTAPSNSPTTAPSIDPTAMPTRGPTIQQQINIFLWMNISLANCSIRAADVIVSRRRVRSAENALLASVREEFATQSLPLPTSNEVPILLKTVNQLPVIARRLLSSQQTNSMTLSFQIGVESLSTAERLRTLASSIGQTFATILGRLWDQPNLTTTSITQSEAAVVQNGSHRPQEWWTQFARPEFLFIACLVPIFMILIPVGAIHAKCTSNVGYKPFRVIKFGFLTVNTFTDIAFAWSLISQNLIFFTFSAIFVFIPFVGSLYAWFHMKYELRKDEKFASWEIEHDCQFLMLSLISGSTFGAFEVAHSRLFGIELFSMDLPLADIWEFLSKRLVFTVLMEDCPQFIIQVAWLITTKDRLNNVITVAALTASIVSITLGVYNAANKKQQAVNRRENTMAELTHVTSKSISDKDQGKQANSDAKS